MSYKDFGTDKGAGSSHINPMQQPEYKQPASSAPPRAGADHSHIPSGLSLLLKKQREQAMTPKLSPIIDDYTDQKKPGVVAVAVAPKQQEPEKQKPKKKPVRGNFALQREIYNLLDPEKPTSAAIMKPKIGDGDTKNDTIGKALKRMIENGSAKKVATGLFIKGDNPPPDTIKKNYVSEGASAYEVKQKIKSLLSDGQSRTVNTIAQVVKEKNMRINNALRDLKITGEVEPTGIFATWRAVGTDLMAMDTKPESDTGTTTESKPDQEIDIELAELLRETMITKPSHYNWHPIAECIDIVQEFPYNLGTSIAYIWRSNHKGDFKGDILKAIEHLKKELKRQGFTDD